MYVVLLNQFNYFLYPMAQKYTWGRLLTRKIKCGSSGGSSKSCKKVTWEWREFLVRIEKLNYFWFRNRHRMYARSRHILLFAYCALSILEWSNMKMYISIKKLKNYIFMSHIVLYSSKRLQWFVFIINSIICNEIKLLMINTTL